MDKRLKPLALLYTVLLLVFGFFGSIIVVDAPEPTPTVGRAEYDYYVVAGHNMTPTLPPPAPQPSGFTFTLEGFAENGTGLHSLGTGGYDFGSLSYHGGRTYLTTGSAISEPTGSNWNAYVVVNITSNLGYTVTIEDLTAEVTDGTPKGNGLPGWIYPVTGENLANFSMVVLDTFDPWDYNIIDEVNYNTGEIHQIREDDYPDHYWATFGAIKPTGMGKGRGPGSLLLNDLNGDATATGHVATKYGGSTITLNDDETFTEYFGLNILGDVAVGTQINATITVRFYYSPPPEGEQTVVDAQMSVLQLFFPAFLEETVYMYPEWVNFNINVTLQNLGNVPVNLTVNVYYYIAGSWIKSEPPQTVLNLSAATTQVSNFYWNVKSANIPIGWTFLKANATATSGSDSATCEFTVQVRCVLTGNSDGDGDVDVGDQRVVQLAMFSAYPQQKYINYNNNPSYGPSPRYTDFDGDLDVDVGDQRKQQLHMFESDPTQPQT